jgi:hypothetical protein
MNIKKLIREEIDAFDWAKEDTIHFGVGTCLRYETEDLAYEDEREWIVVGFSKTPSGTEILDCVCKNCHPDAIKKMGLSKSHVEEDLHNGDMTFCQPSKV